MTKIRGFEKISPQQFEKDMNNFNLYEDVKLPRRATKHSAGYDIFALQDIHLKTGEMAAIPTGIKCFMQSDEWLSIHVRSGHGFKYNIRLKNQVGVIDSDYYDNVKNEGHIFVALQNEGEKDFFVKKGEAFAQAIFHKYLVADNDFVETTRNGGFGSTG
ncbi:MAG: dUTP diphosphatase [Candidatus Marinimicrobia bacterium]|nr:dUTP diphosphatase [Candidatus Neomarinimicrobiota bacterium]